MVWFLDQDFSTDTTLSDWLNPEQDLERDTHVFGLWLKCQRFLLYSKINVKVSQYLDFSSVYSLNCLAMKKARKNKLYFTNKLPPHSSQYG
jgi:hypothetical protein